MQCERHGCANKFKRKGFKTNVFDERKTVPTKMWVSKRKGEIEHPNKFYIKDYKGHIETWCEICYLMYEGFKYEMIYHVEDSKIKYKRKLLSAELVADMPNTVTKAIKNAPIVEDIVNENEAVVEG